MVQKISEPVSVNLNSDHINHTVFPESVLWNNRLYKVDKVGLRHSYREGRILYHVFSVTAKTLFLRLSLNTENLSWKLEEISDGMSD